MTTTQSAGEREQERLAMVATLESLRLHYRPDMNEVFSGADEYLSGRIDAVEAMWTHEEKSALWLAIGNHSDALCAWRGLTFWGRMRWLVCGR